MAVDRLLTPHVRLDSGSDHGTDARLVPLGTGVQRGA